jgi:hypothetical protein
MKHLKKFNTGIVAYRKFNESVDHNKVNSFIQKANSLINYDESEFEQGDEPMNVDLLSELGELYNDMDMTPEDLSMVVTSGRLNDDNNLVKIILDEVQSESTTDTNVRTDNTPLEKVDVYYACMNGGDGSVSVRWYLTYEEAVSAEENQSEGWGEPCDGHAETFVGSNIHKLAKRNSK